MRNYEFLLLEREHGHLDELMRRGYLNVTLLTKMAAYAYHLEHPKASTWQVANQFRIDQKTVRNLYAEMEREG